MPQNYEPYRYSPLPILQKIDLQFFSTLCLLRTPRFPTFYKQLINIFREFRVE